MNVRRPGWYLTPYILWLGFADWWGERAAVTHGQAIAQLQNDVKRHGITFIQRVGIGAGLFAIFALFVANLFAPAVESLAPRIPADAVLPASAGLAGLALLAILSIVMHRTVQTLMRTYARGVRVWMKRQSLYMT